jgi:hypothetical protein
MSNPDDSTQPIPPSDLPDAISNQTNGNPNNGENSIQAGTLPSTAIGGHTDTNKMGNENPLPVAINPIAAAFPFAPIHQALPEFHRPMMSQMDGTLFDDSVLFGDSVPPSAPIISEPVSIPSNELPKATGNNVLPSASEEHLIEAPQQANLENSASHVAEGSAGAESISNTSYKSIIPEKTGENGTEVNGTEKMTGIVETSENPDLAVEVPVIAENVAEPEALSERERDLMAILAMSDAENAESAKKVEAASPAAPKRVSRHRRPSRASQALNYRYNDNDTLENDSEDEEGGWNEKDEMRATQQLLAPRLSFGSDDEADPSDLHPAMAVNAPQSDEEVQPEAKRPKTKEAAPNPTHTHQAPVLDDDIEYNGSVAAKPARNPPTDVSVIDSDEEASVSKPRPALGNVGIPFKPSEYVTVDRGSKGVSGTSRVVTKKTSKKSIVVEEREDIETDSDHTSSTQASQGRKTEKKAIPKSGKSGQNEPQRKSVGRVRNVDDDDDDVDIVPVLTRPKRSLEGEVKAATSRKSVATAGGRASRGAKDIEPGEELAKALRQNARKSIAAYLQRESEDMAEYFTQRAVDMDMTKAQEPPKNMLARYSFIVTGLKPTGTAEGGEFIKTNIRFLGGKIVNSRTFTRSSASVAKRALKKRVDNGEDPERAELEEGMARCILISDKPQRTLKYISALASGVPCVHYRWFLASYQQGRVLPLQDFLLPAGYNEDAGLVLSPEWMCLEDQSQVPYHELYPFIISYDSDDEDEGGKEKDSPRPSSAMEVETRPAKSSVKGKGKAKVQTIPKPKSDAGQQYRVELVGRSEFKRQWSAMLSKLGAKIVERLDAARDYGRLDYVLSDSEPPPLIILLAKARNLPICTIDWAIQTIIHRKVQDPMSQPAYTLEIPE